MSDPLEGLPDKRKSAMVLTAAVDSASSMLIELAVLVNAETAEIVRSNVTMDGKPVGDWKVTVQKLGFEENEAEQLEMFDVPAAPPTAGPGHGES